MKRVVLAENVYVDEDGRAFSCLLDGKWLAPEDQVYVPWGRVGYKQRVRIVVEVPERRASRKKPGAKR